LTGKIRLVNLIYFIKNNFKTRLLDRARFCAIASKGETSSGDSPLRDVDIKDIII